MFGWLKKHHKGDYEDIRSSVLSEPMEPEPDFPRERPPPNLDDPFRKVEEPLGGPPRFEEPPGFGSIDTRAPERNVDDKYDIMDRLQLIESQLSAIRSQTETINERLKNIERSLPRRY